SKLRKIQTLRISYNAQETPFFCHTRIQSIYLQAWLASRLQWSLKTSNVKNDILSLSYTNPNKQEVSVVIEPQRQATLPPGLIISLELSDGQQESFHFERSLNVPNQISCNYSSNVA